MRDVGFFQMKHLPPVSVLDDNLNHNNIYKMISMG